MPGPYATPEHREAQARWRESARLRPKVEVAAAYLLSKGA